MFPASWDPTQAVKKRRKTFLEETEEQAAQCLPQVRLLQPGPPTVPT